MSPKSALAALVAFAVALPAAAAELPSRQGQSEPPKSAKTCEIKGKKGFLSADGQTCITFSGYISGGVEGGTSH
jgi:hypothetical protein